MEPGQVLLLVYGDGRTEPFIVRQIRRLQALDPLNTRSMFYDLDYGRFLPASQLFREVFGQAGHVILQTCIQAHNDLSWGRLFIVAEPYGAASGPAETTVHAVSFEYKRTITKDFTAHIPYTH
jgi:hypothetical protein